MVHSFENILFVRGFVNSVHRQDDHISGNCQNHEDVEEWALDTRIGSLGNAVVLRFL